MGHTLYEGWAILTFDGKPPVAGLLRHEHLGGTLYEWVIEVPAAHHHNAYVAIISRAR